MEIRKTVKQLQSSLRRLQLLEQNLEIADKLLLADLMRKSFYDFESGRSVIENEI